MIRKATLADVPRIAEISVYGWRSHRAVGGFCVPTFFKKKVRFKRKNCNYIVDTNYAYVYFDKIIYELYDAVIFRIRQVLALCGLKMTSGWTNKKEQ